MLSLCEDEIGIPLTITTLFQAMLSAQESMVKRFKVIDVGQKYLENFVVILACFGRFLAGAFSRKSCIILERCSSSSNFFLSRSSYLKLI